MAENNEYKKDLEKTIDTLFTDKPGAPVSIKKAESTVKVAPKPEAVPTAKPEVKAEAKPEAAPTAKPEAVPTAKPEVKAEAKPEVKTAAKAESVPAPEIKKNVPTAKAPVRAKKEPKPVEKESAWVHIMTVCALIVSLSIAGVALLACFFYFGPGSVAADGKPMVAYFSMIMCVVVCAVFVGLIMGTVFVLRKIEKDIREIKSKL